MHRGELYRSVKRALVYSRVSTDAQEQGSLLKHSNLMSADLDGLLEFDQIVVGVIYGTRESLTDKYDIIRGINRRCRSCLRQTLRALPSVARAPSILLT